MNRIYTRTLLLSVAAAVLVLATHALTQPKDQQQGRMHAAFPTGHPDTSLVSIESTAPTEVRLGEPYQYQLKVTNLSKTMTLHSVMVRQSSPAGIEVTKSNPPARTNQEDEGNQPGAEQPAADEQPQPKGQPAPKGQPNAKGQPAPKGEQQSAGGRMTTWNIGTLSPGQTRVITVTAVAHELGNRAACVTVTYDPAFCMSMRVVKSDLEVRKYIPKRVDICDPIPVKYTVRNVGQVAAPNVVLKEDLPKGLTTRDGKQQVTFQVGNLAAGASKDFTVHLIANSTGDYTSQAIATSGKQSFQSRQTSTSVVRANLNVTINGPEISNVGSPAGYTVTVENTGEAVARSTQLRVGVAGPQVALVQATQQGRAADKEGLVWNLGDIKPNESRKVTFSLNFGAGEIKIAATAESACAAGNNIDTTAAALTTTTATAYPALLLSFVDEVDPIQIGNETSYAASVINQGQADDHDVTLTVTLPEGLKPIKATGATEGKIEGNVIRFTPVKTLRPGARADWKIIAEATQPGDFRAKAQLDSKYLKEKPVISVEPTRGVR